jgi:general stress protein YciG
MSALHRLAGSLGGQTTLLRHGAAFFSTIGSLGGRESTNKGGSPNGGLAVLAKYGVDYFSQIGKRGGRPTWREELERDKALREQVRKRNGRRG